MALLEIDEETCAKCGACVAACGGTLIVPQKSGYPKLFPGADRFCLRCGHCVGVCPTGSAVHREMPPERLASIDGKLGVSFDQVSQLIKSRRSIREFREERVPRELLERIIETARYAPSGHNLQELLWLVVDGEEEMRRLAGVGLEWARALAGGSSPMAMEMKGMLRMREYGVDLLLRDAPALIVACAERGNQMAPTDCAIALGYFDLAAKSAGLGCFWNGYFALSAQTFPPMAEALGLPEGYEAYAAMCVGYPRFEYRRIPPRRAASIAYRP